MHTLTNAQCSFQVGLEIQQLELVHSVERQDEFLNPLIQFIHSCKEKPLGMCMCAYYQQYSSFCISDFKIKYNAKERLSIHRHVNYLTQKWKKSEKKPHKNYKCHFYYYHFLVFSQKEQKLFKTSQGSIKIPNTDLSKRLSWTYHITQLQNPIETVVTKTDCHSLGGQQNRAQKEFTELACTLTFI